MQRAVTPSKQNVLNLMLIAALGFAAACKARVTDSTASADGQLVISDLTGGHFESELGDCRVALGVGGLDYEAREPYECRAQLDFFRDGKVIYGVRRAWQDVVAMVGVWDCNEACVLTFAVGLGNRSVAATLRDGVVSVATQWGALKFHETSSFPIDRYVEQSMSLPEVWSRDDYLPRRPDATFCGRLVLNSPLGPYLVSDGKAVAVQFTDSGAVLSQSGALAQLDGQTNCFFGSPVGAAAGAGIRISNPVFGPDLSRRRAEQAMNWTNSAYKLCGSVSVSSASLPKEPPQITASSGERFFVKSALAISGYRAGCFLGIVPQDRAVAEFIPTGFELAPLKPLVRTDSK